MSPKKISIITGDSAATFSSSSSAGDKLPSLIASSKDDSPNKPILKKEKSKKDNTNTYSGTLTTAATATATSAASTNKTATATSTTATTKTASTAAAATTTTESSASSPLKAPKIAMKFLLQLPFDEKTDCISPDMKFKFEDARKIKVEEIIAPVAAKAVPKEGGEGAHGGGGDDDDDDEKQNFSLGVIKAVSIAKETPKRRKKAKNENPDGTAIFLNPFFEVRKKTEMFSGSRAKSDEVLSIEEKAKRMSFSTVALRNWIQHSE